VRRLAALLTLLVTVLVVPAPAPAQSVGRSAWVSVAVARLWQSPSAPRAVDAPALAATAPHAPPGQLMPSPFSDAIWTHDPSHVYTAAAALVAIAVAALVAATIVLRRQLLATK